MTAHLRWLSLLFTILLQLRAFLGSVTICSVLPPTWQLGVTTQ